MYAPLYYGYFFEHLCKRAGVADAISIGSLSTYRSYDTRLIDLIRTGGALVPVLCLAACAIVGYLCASVSFSVLISRTFFRDDIRSHGSGNAGSTNMLRTYGWPVGVATLFLDMLKAAVPVIGAQLFFGEGGGYIAMLGCILGHAFPLFHHFRGGKGVAVAAASVLCLSWQVFLIEIMIFLILVLCTKYVSFGSIVSALFYPMVLSTFRIVAPGAIKAIVSVLVAAFIIALHKENIHRLLNKEEKKFSFKGKA